MLNINDILPQKAINNNNYKQFMAVTIDCESIHIIIEVFTIRSKNRASFFFSGIKLFKDQPTERKIVSYLQRVSTVLILSLTQLPTLIVNRDLLQNVLKVARHPNTSEIDARRENIYNSYPRDKPLINDKTPIQLVKVSSIRCQTHKQLSYPLYTYPILAISVNDLPTLDIRSLGVLLSTQYPI